MVDYSNAGERVVPLCKDWNFFSHLSVYRLAASYMSGRVLDAGCGTGYGTACLVEYGIEHVTGIDYSDLAIAFCKDRYRNERLAFLVGNMENALPFPDDCFDSIFSSNAMEHVANVDGLLGECARVLKHSGSIFIAVPAIVTPQAMAENIANPHHLTNLAPVSWYAKIGRCFDDVRCFSHWPLPRFGGWENIRAVFPLPPERTTIRETDFALQERAIAELDELRDNLNVVFIATKPRGKRMSSRHTRSVARNAQSASAWSSPARRRK